MDLDASDAAVWPGAPVQCVICLTQHRPYQDKDDHCWRLPVHRWTDGWACPGSMRVVTAAPVPRSMEERIEANMVAAMPPDPNTDIPADRAVEVFDA